ncbi:hypothetical protein AB0D46_35780 [Streptomyces sp. NPDC048383]|uniref:hypothetical protein n=1 Tax=Streptomyces sp. NPDC048383 TaxID=3155386 RepID=UPI003449C888
MTSRQTNSIMNQGQVPAPVQPPASVPMPVPQQPVGASLTTAIAQGAAQGAARAITAGLVDKFLTHQSAWFAALWNGLPRLWE